MSFIPQSSSHFLSFSFIYLLSSQRISEIDVGIFFISLNYKGTVRNDFTYPCISVN